MSQRNVERVIGRLVTDEAFRTVFLEDPDTVLRILVERGIELNGCEQEALRNLDRRRLIHFAAAIDPSLQKLDLGGDLK